MAQFAPASAAEPSALVELTISCRNLADCDVFSKSDPMCVVYIKTPDMDYWQEISRTETIQNTLNPDFIKKVHIVYRFEVHQNLKFEVYDIDNSHASLEDQDFLGVCETTVGQVVSNVKLILPLTSKFNCGELIVVAEEISHCKDEVTLQFRGRHLDRKDWFGRHTIWVWFPLVRLITIGRIGRWEEGYALQPTVVDKEYKNLYLERMKKSHKQCINYRHVYN